MSGIRYGNYTGSREVKAIAVNAMITMLPVPGARCLAVLAMLSGELVTGPLKLHRQDTNLTDRRGERLSQLYVLIPNALPDPTEQSGFA